MMNVYLDMDEVLVNFLPSMEQVFGFKPGELRKHWTRGDGWKFLPALARATGKEEITEESFYNYLESFGSKFWEYMLPMPWMGKLLNLFDTRRTEVWIVSYPGPHLSAIDGKIAWINRHLGSEFASRFIPLQAKELLAANDAVLIDDRPATIYRFCRRGGKGILFPRFFNDLSEYSDDPLSYVRPVFHYVSLNS